MQENIENYNNDNDNDSYHYNDIFMIRTTITIDMI